MLIRTIFLVVGAAASTLATASTYTQEVCLTKYGAKSAKSIKTVSLLPTITVPIVRKTISTPSVTTTVKAPTSTRTSFVTTTLTATLPQVISTYDTTTTYYETTTSTVVVSSTETDTASPVTVTSTPATSTIATSPDFTPIQSALPGTAKMRRRDKKQALRDRAAAAASPTLPKGLKISGLSKAPYPTEVDCAGLVEVFSIRTSIITAKITLTVTATSPVITVSTTSTITTITSVLPAAASTTSTFSTTSTISTAETSTYSTTTTVTPTIIETAPTPTTYSMCQANNIASSYNGFAIDSISYPGGYSSASANSPYDCCVLCATTPGCGASVSVSTECYLLNAVGSCDASSVSSTFETYQHDTNPAHGFVISNGPCGQYAYEPT